MKLTLIALAALVSVGSHSQTPIWELAHSSINTQQSLHLSDLYFFHNYTKTDWTINFGTGDVWFDCHENVTGSTDAAPWSTYFKPLRQNSWTVGFSGTVTVPGNRKAKVWYTALETNGTEGWTHTMQGYTAVRQHDASRVVSL